MVRFANIYTLLNKYGSLKSSLAIEDINISTKEDPNIIKLSKKLPDEEKNGYVKMMNKYMDVFAWSYEDLKEYDTSIIQHTIPIKPKEKPFR